MTIVFLVLGSLLNYHRDEMNDNAIENKDDYYKINNGKIPTSTFFE